MGKVIAVVGATASGKSSLGIYLAQKLGGAIISADSRQVYKGLDIGTGKVTKKEMGGIPHYLLDVVSPKRQFTVDHFYNLGTKALTTIYRSGKLPMVVGGTGLYADVLLGRMSYAQVPPNPPLRAQLEEKSLKQLFAQLKKLDSKRAKTIEQHNKRRLIRAIEIAKALGKNPPQQPQQKYEVLWIGLSLEPETLAKKIHDRLVARIKAGMVSEAIALHAQGLSYKRMEELGLEYRYLARLLQGKLSSEQFKIELEREINHYAKRQARWFKRNKDIHWVSSKAEALRLAKQFVSGR